MGIAARFLGWFFALLFGVLVFSMLMLKNWPEAPFDCTVFYAADEHKTLGGNNEDWSDPNTRFWIVPGSTGRYGWIKFGFASGFPQGGMNECGLFWDATGCAYLAMPHSEASKQWYPGPLMVKVMEECASVEQAREVLEAYYCEDQYRSQYLIGDSYGVSMIVEGDSIIEKTERYQVLTNFYHSRTDLGGYPCERYNTARAMLEEAPAITTWLFGSVLSATHQEGRYPTQYSNIYDLKEKRIYLFHYHNFEEFIPVDLQEELRKGSRAYDLEPLFSGLVLISPEQNDIISSLPVIFRWRGKRTSSYELRYTTDPDFGHYESVRVEPLASYSKDLDGSWMLLLGLGLPGLLFFKWNTKRKLLICLILLLPVLSDCEDEEKTPVDSTAKEFNLQVQNLQSQSTYYWKLIAHPDGIPDFSSQGLVHSFKTDM